MWCWGVFVIAFIFRALVVLVIVGKLETLATNVEPVNQLKCLKAAATVKDSLNCFDFAANVL